MESFWSIVGRWDPIGQGIAFVLALIIFACTLDGLAKYVTVIIRGWPPCNCCEEEGEDEDLGDPHYVRRHEI